MLKTALIFSPIILVIFPLTATNTFAAQPPPGVNYSLPPASSNYSLPYGGVNYSLPLQEECYGRATTVIEFICRGYDYHRSDYYRAVDCDSVNKETRECPSGYCIITKGNDCAAIRNMFEDYSRNEARCDRCAYMPFPIYD